MEKTLLENTIVSELAIQDENNSLSELSDLQLAVVGGGIAEVVGG